MATIEGQLLALGEREATCLVADAEEHLIARVRVDDAIAGADVEDQEVVGASVGRDIRNQFGAGAHGRDREIHRGLQQRIASIAELVSAFDSLGESYDHGAAVGIGERDQRIGKGSRLDASRLAIEPLVLVRIEEQSAGDVRRLREGSFYRRGALSTLNRLE